MKCDDLKNRLADYLTGGESALDAEARAHLAGCRECKGEFESLSRLWDKMGMLGEEESGKAMRARFYSMLDGYKDGLEISLRQHRHWPGLGQWFGGFLPV